MIFITGDTHIPIDIKKLNTKNFPVQNDLTKQDYVIICGDFGGIWNGSKEDEYWLDWLNEKNFTTLFLDGNHENFDLLYDYPIEKWNNGDVRFIKSNVIHLTRGQIYNINGLLFFTMGGGSSIDRYKRIEKVNWWQEEIPSKKEFNEAFKNLDQYNWMVDYVLSHTCSNTVMKRYIYPKENSELNQFFDILEQHLIFRHWYFGHFHEDKNLDDKHTIIFNKIIQLKEN